MLFGALFFALSLAYIKKKQYLCGIFGERVIMKSDKSTLSAIRKFLVEYKEEYLFGLVLLTLVGLSYGLAPLIPHKLFYEIISPVQNTAIITVTLINTWTMIRHLDGIRVRYVQAWIMATISAIMIAGVSYRRFVNVELLPAEGTFAFDGWEMVGGDLIAWLILAYPSELLRPGWLTWKNSLKRLLPVVVLGVIDMLVPWDLRWLLALVPVVWVALLFKHLRDYRRYAEANYGSVEQTDEKWVIRYLQMTLVLGISWGKLFKRGYTQDEYGTELAKRDQKIEELEDSIRSMRAKIAVYDEAVKWLRNADSDELQRGIEKIRSVPKDVPLP